MPFYALGRQKLRRTIPLDDVDDLTGEFVQISGRRRRIEASLSPTV